MRPFMCSGPIEALILLREDAIEHWRQLMGPTKVYKTWQSHPDSIRGTWGLTDTRNTTHGSGSYYYYYYYYSCITIYYYYHSGSYYYYYHHSGITIYYGTTIITTITLVLLYLTTIITTITLVATVMSCLLKNNIRTTSIRPSCIRQSTS